VKRTGGISTTDLVGRMLLLTKTHFIRRKEDGSVSIEKKDLEDFSKTTRVGAWSATTRKIEEFSTGKEPKSDDKIVYIDGAFDLFRKKN
jgi:ethanolamine-phosphate cytidylyltransferase